MKPRGNIVVFDLQGKPALAPSQSHGSCCVGHDSMPASASDPIISLLRDKYFSVSIVHKGAPLSVCFDSFGVTQALRAMAEAAESNEGPQQRELLISSIKLCKLHREAVGKGCKLGAACRNVHLCKKVLLRDGSGVGLTATTATSTVSSGGGAVITGAGSAGVSSHIPMSLPPLVPTSSRSASPPPGGNISSSDSSSVLVKAHTAAASSSSSGMPASGGDAAPIPSSSGPRTPPPSAAGATTPVRRILQPSPPHASPSAAHVTDSTEELLSAVPRHVTAPSTPSASTDCLALSASKQTPRPGDAASYGAGGGSSGGGAMGGGGVRTTPVSNSCLERFARRWHVRRSGGSGASHVASSTGSSVERVQHIVDAVFMAPRPPSPNMDIVMCEDDSDASALLLLLTPDDPSGAAGIRSGTTAVGSSTSSALPGMGGAQLRPSPPPVALYAGGAGPPAAPHHPEKSTSPVPRPPKSRRFSSTLSASDGGSSGGSCGVIGGSGSPERVHGKDASVESSGEEKAPPHTSAVAASATATFAFAPAQPPATASPAYTRRSVSCELSSSGSNGSPHQQTSQSVQLLSQRQQLLHTLVFSNKDFLEVDDGASPASSPPAPVTAKPLPVSPGGHSSSSSSGGGVVAFENVVGPPASSPMIRSRTMPPVTRTLLF